MFTLLAIVISLVVTSFGYMVARRFTADRLRYVEAAQGLKAPIIAGVVAAIVATPVAWLLPLVGTGTAIMFGVSVALGVLNGARSSQHRLGA